MSLPGRAAESSGEASGPARILVTDRVLEALREEGLDPARSVLTIQHILGCGGTGFRLSWKTEAPDDGHLVAANGGLTIWMDDYSHTRLAGAVIDYDTEKETEGYYLDHPDAAVAAFC